MATLPDKAPAQILVMATEQAALQAIDTILSELADITMNAIVAKPKEREAIQQAGFELFWKGSAA